MSEEREQILNTIARQRRLGRKLVLLAVALGAGLTAYYVFYNESRLPPEQPIAFSHRLHAGDKQISCLVCHTGVVDSAHAGIPSLETCMLCHKKVVIHYPQIVMLRSAYENRTPVEWTKVTNLPEYVHFNHQLHIRKGHDCGECHGDVKRMDRVGLAYDLQMGFCIGCHRANDVTHDCFTCHR